MRTTIEFVQRTHRMGLRIDVSNVADAIDLIEVSADSDFARFPEVTWINPLTA